MDIKRSCALKLVVVLSILGELRAHHETISFPMRYVYHSIDLGIGSEDLHLPTGKCEEATGRLRDLSLILPRSCVPKTLYSGFISSDRVTCLSLRESQIQQVPYGSFDCMPNLYYLDLSKNRIQFCDLLSFGGHANLMTLIVDENAIGAPNTRLLAIDHADFFPRLEHLYIRKNQLSQLRLSLRQSFPILTHLYLSDNFLTTEGLSGLTDIPRSLTHLHLERNRIRRIESHLLCNLRYLHLDGNSIGSICSSYCLDSSIDLRGAGQLRFLSLSGNDIASIDRDSFRDAGNIRTLNLAHNRLELISPSALDHLVNLEDLSLSYNRLSHLPELRKSQRLMSLTIDHNTIAAIHAGSFCHLTELKWLSLNSNRLQIVESGAFRNLRMLEELDLSDNELDHLPYLWIDPETHLRQLDLRGNRFSTYDNIYLRNIGSLTDLYLQGNPCSISRPSARNYFERNVTVHVDYGVTYTTRPCYVFCNGNTRFTKYYYD